MCVTIKDQSVHLHHSQAFLQCHLSPQAAHVAGRQQEASVIFTLSTDASLTVNICSLVAILQAFRRGMGRP